MSHADIEIELKYPLANAEAVSAFLDEHGTLVTKNSFQRDTYYVPAHRDYLKEKCVFEWLRIRESNERASVNYKHFYPEDRQETDYCDEYETPVDDAEQMKKIFAGMGCTARVVVEKTRSIWNYKDVEVAVDNVKDLGTFIEIESNRHFENPKDGKPYLRKVLAELGAEVGKEENFGYPKLLLMKRP